MQVCPIVFVSRAPIVGLFPSLIHKRVARSPTQPTGSVSTTGYAIIFPDHMVAGVFYRRTSVRLARSPFENHRKMCVLARVLASYLYTFGSKPVQKSSTITCVGTCFGIVFIYVWLETRSKINENHDFEHVF